MDKRLVESFKAFQIRRTLHDIQREVRNAHYVPTHTTRAPPFTPNELDRFMQRRIEHDSQQDARTLQWTTGRKTKLPLPVFACEIVGAWITCRCGEHHAPEFHTCPKCGSVEGVAVSVRVPGPKRGQS